MVKIKFKRGQIASTISWFVATLAVFFIMLLFLFFTVVLTGGKILPSWLGGGGGLNEIFVTKSENLELQAQRTLSDILNTPVENTKTIKDLIIEWDRTGKKDVENKIENKVKEVSEANKGNDECYAFVIDGNGRKLEFDGFYLGKTAMPVNVTLYPNDINVKFYFGKC